MVLEVVVVCCVGVGVELGFKLEVGFEVVVQVFGVMYVEMVGVQIVGIQFFLFEVVGFYVFYVGIDDVEQGD